MKILLLNLLQWRKFIMYLHHSSKSCQNLLIGCKSKSDPKKKEEEEKEEEEEEEEEENHKSL